MGRTRMPGAAGTDLFATPIVAGLSQWRDLVSRPAQQDLIAGIEASALVPFRFQGWEGKRLTASFGWSYDFTTGQMVESAPIPAFLLDLRERMAAAAGLEARQLEQALLIRYDPGAGIGWHRDRPQYQHVLGLSLGAPAVLRLRRRLGTRDFQRASADLEPGAAYHLAGEVRDEWEHSIAAGVDTRWSVTFRSLSERGRRALVR